MKKLLVGLIVLAALLSVPMAVSAANTADVSVTADLQGTFTVSCTPGAAWAIKNDPDYLNASQCVTTGNIAYDTQVNATHDGYLYGGESLGTLANQLDVSHAAAAGAQPTSWQDLTGTVADFQTPAGLVNIVDGGKTFDLWLQQDLAPDDVAGSYSVTVTITLIAAI